MYVDGAVEHAVQLTIVKQLNVCSVLLILDKNSAHPGHSIELLLQFGGRERRHTWTFEKKLEKSGFERSRSSGRRLECGGSKVKSGNEKNSEIRLSAAGINARITKRISRVDESH